jgi:hypothetical protein
LGNSGSAGNTEENIEKESDMVALNS